MRLITIGINLVPISLIRLRGRSLSQSLSEPTESFRPLLRHKARMEVLNPESPSASERGGGGTRAPQRCSKGLLAEPGGSAALHTTMQF